MDMNEALTHGWIRMDGHQVDLDMNGYGWIGLLYGLDWIWWIYLHSNTYGFFSLQLQIEMHWRRFQVSMVNRNSFPPLGNLTPQDAESELKLELSRVPLPTAWARTYCICEYQCFPYQCFPPCCHFFFFSQVKRHSTRLVPVYSQYIHNTSRFSCIFMYWPEVSPLHQT